MYTGKRYTIKDLVIWTRRETLLFIVIAVIPTILYETCDLKWLHFPWTPLALIGTALAFMIGFQNNAAYGRIWEARKIWGGIVNTSRTWAMKVQTMISNEYSKDPMSDTEMKKEVQVFVHRHIAWLTALRHAMRESRKWEVVSEAKTNREWQESVFVPEHRMTTEKEIEPYLSKEDHEFICGKKNMHGAVLFLQAAHLKRLKERGIIWEFAFLDLMNILEEFFTLQGKSERIKNFPYPRQYATLGYYFVWVFIFLLPFGIVPEFHKIAGTLAERYTTIDVWFVWLAIPFCVIVSWIFHTMERIGRTGENPFEGSPNDVPISTIARGIEIDIRQLTGEDPDLIPAQFPEQRNVQM